MLENILLMTGPLPEGIQTWSSIFNERIYRSDLCGTSWTERPKDLIDLAFHTFKPLFCEGARDVTPSALLLSRIKWLTWKEGSIIDLTGSKVDKILFQDGLMIISSASATNALLGTSLARWYQAHINLMEARGDKRGVMIDEVDLPSTSPLLAMYGHGCMIEVVVLPPPGRNPLASQLYDEGPWNDLRCDYIRRIHQALGCEKHEVW